MKEEEFSNEIAKLNGNQGSLAVEAKKLLGRVNQLDSDDRNLLLQSMVANIKFPITVRICNLLPVWLATFFPSETLELAKVLKMIESDAAGKSASRLEFMPEEVAEELQHPTKEVTGELAAASMNRNKERDLLMSNIEGTLVDLVNEKLANKKYNYITLEPGEMYALVNEVLEEFIMGFDLADQKKTLGVLNAIEIGGGFTFIEQYDYKKFTEEFCKKTGLELDSKIVVGLHAENELRRKQNEGRNSGMGPDAA